MVGGAKKVVHVCRMKPYAEASLGITAAVKLSAEHYEEAHVDEFVSVRLTDQGYEVRVRWRGFDDVSDTWEPIGNLAEDVPAMLKTYAKEAPDVAFKNAVFKLVK